MVTRRLSHAWLYLDNLPAFQTLRSGRVGAEPPDRLQILRRITRICEIEQFQLQQVLVPSAHKYHDQFTRTAYSPSLAPVNPAVTRLWWHTLSHVTFFHLSPFLFSFPFEERLVMLETMRLKLGRWAMAETLVFLGNMSINNITLCPGSVWFAAYREIYTINGLTRCPGKQACSAAKYTHIRVPVCRRTRGCGAEEQVGG